MRHSCLSVGNHSSSSVVLIVGSVKFGAQSDRPPADPCKLQVFRVKLQFHLIYWSQCLGANLHRLVLSTHQGHRVCVCVCVNHIPHLRQQPIGQLISGSYISVGLTSLFSFFLSLELWLISVWIHQVHISRPYMSPPQQQTLSSFKGLS